MLIKIHDQNVMKFQTFLTVNVSALDPLPCQINCSLSFPLSLSLSPARRGRKRKLAAASPARSGRRRLPPPVSWFIVRNKQCMPVEEKKCFPKNERKIIMRRVQQKWDHFMHVMLYLPLTWNLSYEGEMYTNRYNKLPAIRTANKTSD